MFCLRTYRIEYKMVIVATELSVRVEGKETVLKPAVAGILKRGTSALFFAFNAHT